MKLKKTRYKKPKPFKYKQKPRPPKKSLNRLQGTAEGETLSGYVHGMEASPLEERFARALEFRNLEFIFQHKVQPPTQIPGQENELDFVVVYAGMQPVEVDGMWVHKSAEQKKKDELRDAILDDFLESWKPIIRIPGTDLKDQDDADRIVEELFQ